MAIALNGTSFEWYEKSIELNGTEVAGKNNPRDVYLNGTKVMGLSGFSNETTLLSGGLLPDSSNFENNIVPQLAALIGTAFYSGGYTQGPGKDTTYTVYVKEGYRVVSSDGTFTGTASPGTQVRFYEGHSVTGINTSHNGGTSFTVRRDNGV